MIPTALTILLLPLAVFVLIVFVTRKNQPLSAAVSILAMGGAALLSLFVIFPRVASGATAVIVADWSP